MGDLVVGLPRGLDRRGQLLLDHRLHPRVDRRHQGVPGLRGHLGLVADHPAHRVDRHLLVAGHPAQPRVVLLLDAGPAHHRGAVDGPVAVLLRLVVLLAGDRAEVAEQVRGVDAVRRRVGAQALLLGGHAREVLGLLEHPQRHRLGHVDRDRHRLERRPVPAVPLHGLVVAARREQPVDPRHRHVGHPRDAVQQRALLVVRQLGQGAAVDRDHPRGAVRDQRPALVVDDQPALRLDDDLADRLRGGLGGVLVTADDLQVVEPDQQRREQREHQRLDHHQPEPAAVLAGRAGHARTRSGSTFANSPRVRGTTTRASATSQTEGHHLDPQQLTDADGRVAQQQPGEREHRRPDERRRRGHRQPLADPRATRGREPPGDVAHHHQRERPAARRSGRPAARGRAAARHRSRAPARARSRRRGRRPPRRAAPGRAPRPAPRSARTREAWSTSADRDREQRGHRARQGEQGVHRRPSTSMRPRSLSVPDGTTTPTTSRAEKSTNGVITARWVVSRRLE